MLRMEAQEHRRDSSIIIVQWWLQFLGQNWLEKTHAHDVKSCLQFLITLAMKMIKDHEGQGCNSVLLLGKTETHLVQTCTFQMFPLTLWVPSLMETSGSNLVKFRCNVQMTTARQSLLNEVSHDPSNLPLGEMVLFNFNQKSCFHSQKLEF